MQKMGEYASPNRDKSKLMKILIHYEKLEDSTGYYALDFDRFLEDVMFLDTLVYSVSEARY